MIFILIYCYWLYSLFILFISLKMRSTHWIYNIVDINLMFYKTSELADLRQPKWTYSQVSITIGYLNQIGLIARRSPLMGECSCSRAEHIPARVIFFYFFTFVNFDFLIILLLVYGLGTVIILLCRIVLFGSVIFH